MSTRFPKVGLLRQVVVGVSFVVLVVGLVLTFVVWKHARDDVEQRVRDKFAVEADRIDYALTKRIGSYYNVLFALQGLFAASDSVERREWDPFVRTAGFSEYPDIDYIAYIEVVGNDNKDAFTQDFRNDKSMNPAGYPDLNIYPEGERDSYAVIKYIFPEDSESSRALGFDLYSNPQRRAALNESIETNTPAASGVINLATDGSPGILMTLPVYKNGEPVSTAAERKAALSGFVNVVFKQSNLFTNVFLEGGNPDLAFAIYDGDTLLFTKGEAKYIRDGYKPNYYQTETLEVGGRSWTLEIVATPNFENAYLQKTPITMVGLGGALISILLFLVIYYSGERTSQLIRLQSAALLAAANGIIITDIKEIVLWVNPAFTKFTGYHANEVIGKPRYMLRTVTQNEEFYVRRWETILAGKAWKGEFTNKRKDGSLYQEEEIIAPIKDRNGHITNFIEVIQNVTERKEFREKLLSANRELESSEKVMVNILGDLDTERDKLVQEKAKDEAIFESIGEGLVITDKAGRILVVNKAFEDLIGWKASEVIGKDMVEVVPKYDEHNNLIPKESRSITNVLEGKIKKGNESTLEKTHFYTRRDKTKLPIVGTATPIILNDKIAGAVQVFRDVSKDIEIGKMKDEFMNIAAHDLRTPSAAIRGFISRVLDGDAGVISAKAKDLLKSAYDGNLRLISLVDDFLMVSRIERGKIKVQPKVGNLGNAVTKAIAETEGIAKEKGLYIKYEKTTLPNVLLDEGKIIELLINLIGNAIKFTETGGITITHEVADGEVITNVADTGIGIPKESQSHLFEKYFKISVSEVAQSGLGLGLYISKLIVDGHKGKIWVKSAETKGSTFSFSLTVAK